jgi:hypothetical protein
MRTVPDQHHGYGGVGDVVLPYLPNDIFGILAIDDFVSAGTDNSGNEDLLLISPVIDEGFDFGFVSAKV